MLDFLKQRPLLLASIASSVISVLFLCSEVALFVLSLLILAFIFFLIYKRVKGELIFSAILVLAVTVSGFLTASKAENLKAYDGVLCTGEFTVVSNPVNHSSFYSVTLETVKSDVLDSGEKIGVTYNNISLEFSDKIYAEIKLSKYDQNQKAYGFYAEGQFMCGNVKTAAKTGRKDSVLSAVNDIRKYIKTVVFENYGTEEAATVMALVAGDKTYFSPRFEGNVKAAGVAHVMVVSGMHLSVIVSMLLYICNRFLYNRFLKAVVILFATFAVMTVCGFTMSVMRAGITYILIAFSLIINRESTAENTLGFAVVIILIINPFAIFSIAFELSVLSTFAILVVALPVTEYLSKRDKFKSKIIDTVLSSCIISISALIFTAPITIYYFGYISTVSIITNLLIGSATSFIIIFCILGFLVPFLFFRLSELLTSYINTVINFFGSLPYATVNLSRIVIIFAILIIIVILLGIVACKVKLDMVKLKSIRDIRKTEGGNGIYVANFRKGIKGTNKKRK